MITAAANGSSVGGMVGSLAFAVGIVALYWLPTLIAWRRRVPNLVSIMIVNVLLGWTVIAWIVCLAWACKSLKPPVPGNGAGASSV